MSLKDFVPNSANFVHCSKCLFFVMQKDLFNKSVKGYCKNEYLYRMAPYHTKYTKIFDPEHMSCGSCLPHNTKINPDEYFNKDNSADEKQ